MTRESLVIRNPGYRRHGSNHKKSRPCFVTKSVRFGRTELLFFFRVANREIYNLSMVSGPVLLKIKGKSWIFIFLESKKAKKI